MKKLKKLKIEPIVESICEIRYSINESLPVDLQTAIFISSLNLTSAVETLPILQMPEQIRKSDPNLRYIPYYKFQFNDSVVQVGPRVLVVASPLPYIGWDKMRLNLTQILDSLLKNPNVSNIERIGLRAIDFFDFDVINKTTVKYTGPVKLPVEQYNYLVVYNKEKSKVKLQIANQANFETITSKRTGSLIDIDAFCDNDLERSLDFILSKVAELHDLSKEIFVQTLTSEYLNELGPQYE
jgi:uncharacterized protein (TIGR04255 family)